MKNVALPVAVLALFLMVAMWGWLSTPIVQMSSNTKQPVACASAETNWEFKSMEVPACQKVAKGRRAEVEWVQ